MNVKKGVQLFCRSFFHSSTHSRVKNLTIRRQSQLYANDGTIRVLFCILTCIHHESAAKFKLIESIGPWFSFRRRKIYTLNDSATRRKLLHLMKRSRTSKNSQNNETWTGATVSKTNAKAFLKPAVLTMANSFNSLTFSALQKCHTQIQPWQTMYWNGLLRRQFSRSHVRQKRRIRRRSKDVSKPATMNPQHNSRTVKRHVCRSPLACGIISVYFCPLYNTE